MFAIVSSNNDIEITAPSLVKRLCYLNLLQIFRFRFSANAYSFLPRKCNILIKTYKYTLTTIFACTLYNYFQYVFLFCLRSLYVKKEVQSFFVISYNTFMDNCFPSVFFFKSSTKFQTE